MSCVFITSRAASGRGRRDHDGDLAELEVDYGRVEPARHVGDGAVGERAAEEVVEAADDRQLPRSRRRQPQYIAVVATLLELEEEERDS
jgi:hypothetical protein